MDISRAIRLMSHLREVDQSESVSRLLTDLRQRMDQLVSSPTDSGTQTSVVEASRKLRQAIAAAISRFSPEELSNAHELATFDLFAPEIVAKFEQTLTENPATPAVARDVVANAEAERAKVLGLMQDVISAGGDLGWGDYEEAADWEAEVGFKIPREIFSNEFDRLIGEFRFLRRFLSNVAEIEDQSLSDVKLASLSTTDPLIILGVAVVVAERIGKITKWALECWKTVEEIRKIREETRKLKSFSPDEVEAIFGDKIRAEVQASIDQKAKEIAASVADAGRRNELENSFAIHLKEFLGRIERGMTVEIRLLTAPVEHEADDNQEVEDFDDVVASLKFPPPSPNPVLQITQQDGG